MILGGGGAAGSKPGTKRGQQGMGEMIGKELQRSLSRTIATTIKNIIVMISDGMGYNQMLAGDYYLYGQAGKSFAGMPFKSAMSTYAAGDSYDASAAWASFGYVTQNPTDSSAAATAMVTREYREGFVCPAAGNV